MSNPRIKYGIVLFSFLLSLALFFAVPRLTKLEEWYAFISVDFLFLAMLAGPLYRISPNAPFKIPYRQSLGSFGISTFYFAFLHFYITFFYQLLGFRGLPFIENTELAAVIFGAVALLILAVLAATSFDYAVRLLGPTWKTLHRFVYVAAILLVLHVIILGSHFRDFTNPTALLFIFLFFIILILHTISFRRYLLTTFPRIERRVITTIVCTLFLILTYLLYWLHEIVAGVHHHH